MIRLFIRQFHSVNNRPIVVYHHNIDHPYENTKPMPKNEEEGVEAMRRSIMKVDSNNMITKSPNLEQLQCLTYTPYRYWNQYPGRAKRRRYQECFNDNVDRSGLTS